MILAKAQEFRTLSLTILLVLFPLISSCNDTAPQFHQFEQANFKVPSGKNIKVYIAISAQEQAIGLSGTKPEQFSDSDAMLFPAKEMSERQFWMPETYMDLDLFFMNEDYYILDIHRNLKHFTKRQPEHLVPRSKTVYSQHVLEMKSSSPFSKELQIGMKLEMKKD
jgi:uncharacterized membrane protein (UPF0127 family)